MGPGSCAENPKTKRGPVQREDSRWHVRLTSSWTGLGQRGEAQKAPARIVQDGAAEFLRVTISGAIINGKNLENSGLSEIKQITFFFCKSSWSLQYANVSGTFQKEGAIWVILNH